MISLFKFFFESGHPFFPLESSCFDFQIYFLSEMFGAGLANEFRFYLITFLIFPTIGVVCMVKNPVL